MKSMAPTGEWTVDACRSQPGWNKEHNLVQMNINLRDKLDGIETALLINESRNIPVLFVIAMVDEETVGQPC